MAFFLGNRVQINHTDHDELDIVCGSDSERREVTEGLMVKHDHGTAAAEVSAVVSHHKGVDLPALTNCHDVCVPLMFQDVIALRTT
jgi:hypothetical protein